MDVKAREALQWAADNYANPEINHVDYRVKMVHLAEAALAHRDAQPLEFNEAEGWVRIADGPMAGTYYKQ